MEIKIRNSWESMVDGADNVDAIDKAKTIESFEQAVVKALSANYSNVDIETFDSDAECGTCTVVVEGVDEPERSAIYRDVHSIIDTVYNTGLFWVDAE